MHGAQTEDPLSRAVSGPVPAAGFERLRARRERERAARAQKAASLRARLLERGRPVIERYGVRRVVLFGSVRAGQSTDRSDIDLLVLPLRADCYWSFRHDLEEAVEARVDVYTQDDDPAFVDRMMERGETVFVL